MTRSGKSFYAQGQRNPFNQLKIGDRVISATGKPGSITGLKPDTDPDRAIVEFVWDALDIGWSSIVYHFEADKVEYIGPEAN